MPRRLLHELLRQDDSAADAGIRVSRCAAGVARRPFGLAAVTMRNAASRQDVDALGCPLSLSLSESE